MSEKFTPGPWEVDKENCHAGQIAVCHGDKDTYFEVWSRHWFGGIDQEANAHLIAAAPEMYEALKAIEWIKEKDGEPAFCPICRHYVHGGHSNECKLGAALKKARGEE